GSQEGEVGMAPRLAQPRPGRRGDGRAGRRGGPGADGTARVSGRVVRRRRGGPGRRPPRRCRRSVQVLTRQPLRGTKMTLLAAAVVLVAAISLFNLALVYGGIRRLKTHTDLITELGQAETPPPPPRAMSPKARASATSPRPQWTVSW